MLDKEAIMNNTKKIFFLKIKPSNTNSCNRDFVFFLKKGCIKGSNGF